MIRKVALSLTGWHTNRKIVVIESDDWGSIRMPSKEVYSKCLKDGYPVDKRPYERYDSLENSSDIIALFETLAKIKDCNGNVAVITANYVLANPDFEKIKINKFDNYYYENLESSYDKYGYYNVVSLIKDGNDSNLFHPQFHGREHFNTHAWLNQLQLKEKDNLFAFNNNMVGITPKINSNLGNQLMVALNYNNEKELDEKNDILIDGLKLFEKLFGYKSKSFIAPCYTWSPFFHESLKQSGVDYIQGSMVQFIGNSNFQNKTSKIYHYTGQVNKQDQLYMIRNVQFEPTLNRYNAVDRALNQIQRAFLLKKPAIITSHRLNYIGSLDLKNRDSNLKTLKIMLSQIIQKWPDVEFMTSDKLGDEILKSYR